MGLQFFVFLYVIGISDEGFGGICSFVYDVGYFFNYVFFCFFSGF